MVRKRLFGELGVTSLLDGGQGQTRNLEIECMLLYPREVLKSFSL